MGCKSKNMGYLADFDCFLNFKMAHWNVDRRLQSAHRWANSSHCTLSWGAISCKESSVRIFARTLFVVNLAEYRKGFAIVGGKSCPLWVLVHWYLVVDERGPLHQLLQLWEPPLCLPIGDAAQYLGSILLGLRQSLGYEFARSVAPPDLLCPVRVPGGS